MATDRFEASLKLQSTDQLELLDVIDTLRATGLSETVAWPQLIVCGGQSSCKSSVLEAISGVPFPRQQNLCTRFATEVILRRASATKITASIRPGEKRTQLERDELLQFTKEARSIDDIKGIFDAAVNAMGLSTGEESFSADILQIKFSGPSQPSLTLVDLPGFIHSATKQQTAQDVSLIDNIVTQYLRRPQSIILAVVSAKNDPGSQIILNKAGDMDPDGRWTLGIITKPDTLTAGSEDEQEFIVLTNNETVKFSLGWHVVRNLNLETENDKLTTREEKEAKFFSESNLRSLPPHLIGISFLRRRLSRVLFDLIRSELPQLVENISAKISVTKEIQAKMGPSRSKVEE
jgi:GTP-binding protein EngB required for normal cell division